MGGEAIPVTGHRSDQVTISTKGAPQRTNLHLQFVFLDNSIGPDPAQQLVLAQHRPAGIDQRQQHIDGPCPEVQLLTVGQ